MMDQLTRKDDIRPASAEIDANIGGPPLCVRADSPFIVRPNEKMNIMEIQLREE
jgi:hypothetical protein